MKAVLEPFKLVDNVSLGASFNSAALEADGYFGLAIQYIVSNAATLNGSLLLQMSNDKTNWVTVPTDTVNAVNPVAITADGSGFWRYLTIIPMKWIRLSYTRTGGTGDVTLLVSGVRLP